MQVKNNFLHEVLNVTLLRSSDKNDPVVGKSFHSGFFPDLSTVTKFQFHLNGTLWDVMLLIRLFFLISTQKRVGFFFFTFAERGFIKTIVQLQQSTIKWH